MKICLPFFLCAALVGCSKCEQKKPQTTEAQVEIPHPPQAEVTIVAKKIDSPLGLAVDHEFIYWGHGPVLRKAPIKGGPAKDVCKVDAIKINSIVVTEKYLYFGAMGGGVFRMSKGGNKPRRIATSENPAYLVVDDKTVYWYDQRIYKRPADAPGDASPPAMFTAGYPGWLCADDTHLYWHDGSRIRRRAKEAEASEDQVLAATGHMGIAMALDDKHLYWGDDTADAVMRIPKEGGAAEYFSGTWSFGATLALDDAWVYIATIDTHIYKVAKDDGRTARLVLSADSGYLYIFYLTVPNPGFLQRFPEKLQVHVVVGLVPVAQDDQQLHGVGFFFQNLYEAHCQLVVGTALHGLLKKRHAFQDLRVRVFRLFLFEPERIIPCCNGFLVERVGAGVVDRSQVVHGFDKGDTLYVELFHQLHGRTKRCSPAVTISVA